MRSISRIIHQTWQDTHVLEHFKLFADTWIKNHPGWEYILWTDEMNRAFIKDNFPAFLEKYDAYPANIQRVDAARYFILYKMGGLYVDLDFECFKNIEGLLDKDCVFGIEPAGHSRIHKKDMIISNAFMACTSQHPFFEVLCNTLHTYNEKIEDPLKNILESTGPFMLSRVYKKYKDKHQITLLSHNLIYPLTRQEITTNLFKDKIPDRIMAKIDEAYALHYHWGTWWNTSEQALNKFIIYKMRMKSQKPLL